MRHFRVVALGAALIYTAASLAPARHAYTPAAAVSADDGVVLSDGGRAAVSPTPTPAPASASTSTASTSTAGSTNGLTAEQILLLLLQSVVSAP